MTTFQSFFTHDGDPFMPFPENAPRVDDLTSIPPQEIVALPVEMLAILQREIDEAAKRVKAAKAHLDGALTIRYATRAEEFRQTSGKDTGIVRLTDGDFTVVADLPKRVSWDQERLAEIAANIAASGDDPAEFIERTLKVPERKYTALPASWRKGFEAARKVGSGKPSFRLEAAEQS